MPLPCQVLRSPVAAGSMVALRCSWEPQPPMQSAAAQAALPCPCFMARLTLAACRMPRSLQVQDPFLLCVWHKPHSTGPQPLLPLLRTPLPRLQLISAAALEGQPCVPPKVARGARTWAECHGQFANGGPLSIHVCS